MDNAMVRMEYREYWVQGFDGWWQFLRGCRNQRDREAF